MVFTKDEYKWDEQKNNFRIKDPDTGYMSGL